MHALMALFFYELVRDQIAFIWHAWAIVVVHRWFVPVCRTMPSLLMMEKKNALIDQVMSKTDFNHLFIYSFMYLFIFAVWFKIWALWPPLICSKCCFTTSHGTTLGIWKIDLAISKTDFLHFLGTCVQKKNAVIQKSLMYMCDHKSIVLFHCQAFTKGKEKRVIPW